MIIPVRCFSCGKPIGHLWEQFKVGLAEKQDLRLILDKIKLKRYCCRAQFMAHIDLMEQIAKFKKG